MAFLSCETPKVQGLTFFATAVFMFSSYRPALESNKFTFPSASRRSLGGNVAEFDAQSAYGLSSSVPFSVDVTALRLEFWMLL